MEKKDLLTLALIGGGAYLLYKGIQEQGLLEGSTETGLAPLPPGTSTPPVEIPAPDNKGYVPYVPPKEPPPPKPIEPYKEPELPPPPSGLTPLQMLRQFFSYLSLYSMYRESEYKQRYKEILPQLLAIAGEKTKEQVITPEVVDILVGRYYVGRAQPMGPQPYGAGWGGSSRKIEGFAILDKATKKRYTIVVRITHRTIGPPRPIGTFIEGDLTALKIADRLMRPNIPIAELVYQAVDLAERVRMPMEVFLLPTWSAAHRENYRPSTYTSGVKLPLQWLRYWIERWNYKPRFIKVPALAISEYHPQYWYVIEAGRKTTPAMKQRLLALLDKIRRPELVIKAPLLKHNPAYDAWQQLEGLLSL
jgi:hypothetical protein